MKTRVQPFRRWGCERALGGVLLAVIVALLPALPIALSAQEVVAQTRLAPPDVAWEDQFSRVESVRELADGRLLVVDRQEQFLYLADPETGEVTTVGSRGEGPGEYRLPGRLYPLVGDSSLFTDFGSRRWLIIDGDEFVETYSATRPLPLEFGPNLSGVSEGGRILGIVETVSRTVLQSEGVRMGRSSADSLRALLSSLSAMESAEVVADTLPPMLAGRGRFGQRTTHSTIPSGRLVSVQDSPLATEDQVWLFHDGWIAVAYESPYRVEWRRPDGSWTGGVPLPHDTVVVGRDEQCFAIERRGLDECDLDRFPEEWPEIVPAFRPDALLPAPDGTLLIRRAPSAADPRSRYDRVDREGTLVETLVLEDDEALVGSSPDHLYLIRTGPLGLQSLRRIPWP